MRSMSSSELINTAHKYIADILRLSFNHTDKEEAVVVYDTGCELSILLTEAYRRAIPHAQFINFADIQPDALLEIFKKLKAGDLAVMIQSNSFRLSEFRIRVELFNLSIKAIEHPHLDVMTGDEIGYYVDSLAYDATYYRGAGQALRELIDRAKVGVVNSGSEKLVYEGGFEPTKLNVGDYTGMKNIGGMFPIGEVFTEAKTLENVNGRVRIFAFCGTGFILNKPAKPITLIIEKGRVTDTVDATPEFNEVLANIVADENEVWVRELGFGLNRAFTKDRTVADIGTYERMCGIHLSLGAKHSVYSKPTFAFSRRTARHHVDVFVDVDSVTLDNEVIYENGAWKAGVAGTARQPR